MKASLASKTRKRIKKFSFRKAFNKLDKRNLGIRNLIKQYLELENCETCNNSCCPKHRNNYKSKGEVVFTYCIYCKEVTKHTVNVHGTIRCENSNKHNYQKKGIKDSNKLSSSN